MSATDDVAVQRGFSRGVGGCAAARVVAMFNSKLRRLVGEQGGESATCATVRGGKCTPTSESVGGGEGGSSTVLLAGLPHSPAQTAVALGFGSISRCTADADAPDNVARDREPPWPLPRRPDNASREPGCVSEQSSVHTSRAGAVVPTGCT